MEDKILKLLDEKNLDLAKQMILEYECKIKDERNQYTRCRMIDRLNLYKRIYTDNIEYDISGVNVRNYRRVDIKTYDTLSNKLKISDSDFNYVFDSSLDISHLKKNLDTKYVEGLIFSDVEIVNSNNLVVGYFEAEQTVYLNNVKDSTIMCKSKQLRLKDSSDVELHIDISSDVSLEGCTGITINNLVSSNNLSHNVRDFSDPFGTKNFKIVN